MLMDMFSTFDCVRWAGAGHQVAAPRGRFSDITRSKGTSTASGDPASAWTTTTARATATWEGRA